jgi:PPP family 3-phenylpropionic acid transporter
VIALHILVTAVGVALGVLYPFISVILAGFGFSPTQIGLISSLGAVGFTLAVPAWGHLADVRLGRPRTLQVCAIGAGLAAASLLLPFPPGLIVVGFLLFWVFESSWQPLADALTVNAVRGRDYARVRTFTSLGFAAGAIIAGRLYDVTGYDLAFVLFAGAAAVILVSSAFLPDVGRADLAGHRASAAAAAGSASASTTDEGAALGPEARRTRFSLGSSGVALQVAPRLALVLLASGLLHISIISGYTFLPLRLIELGGLPSDIALSSGLSAAAEIPAMLAMGGIASRFGVRRIFVASAVLYAACIASWTVLESPTVIVATRAVTGIAFSGVLVSVVLTIARMLPADLQATGQSLFQTTAFGLGAILANLVGGILFGAFGPSALFGTMAVLALVAGVVGWLAFPGRRERPDVRRSSP